MEFRDKILLNEILVDGLRKRSYSLINFPDERMSVFSNDVIDIPSELLINGWDDVRFNCTLNVCSRFVTEQYFERGLFIDEKPNDPIGVLAVDLLWLRWNENPTDAESFKYDYALLTKEGVKRFFEDFDTVGKIFLNSVSTPLGLARLLMDLDKYPIRIRWGGKPRSADPLLYSAMLFLQCGEPDRAKEVYEIGIRKFACPLNDVEWKVSRFQNFSRRGKLLNLA